MWRSSLAAIFRFAFPSLSLLILLPAALPAPGSGGGQGFRGVTQRVSVSSAGEQANGLSDRPAISADGRYVAFESPNATNLVPDDTNDVADVFVHNRWTGVTTRVSVASDGTQSDNGSAFAAISADGRYVAFQSIATNLVPDDTNGQIDVFVHDRETGVTSRVSVRTGGKQASIGGGAPAISADGRYVAFMSPAPDLVDDDTNGTWDVFVHDRETCTTTRVSVASDGTEGNGPSTSPAISGDGRYVAFVSAASNLVPGDTNGVPDVFVHDRKTGVTERVSVDSDGRQGNNFSGALNSFHHSYISGDGRYVAFMSAASNLVPDDSNGVPDVFVHDRETGATERVSVDSHGRQANNLSYFPTLSGDGRYVAFGSFASNLVPGDTNGVADVFVHDRETGITTRVSLDNYGIQGNHHSAQGDGGIEPPVLSADGRYVAFTSAASNLVPDDTNGWPDIFVHDRAPDCVSQDLIAYVHGDAQGQPQIFTSAPDGSCLRQLTQSPGGNFVPAWSPDGERIAFTSGRTGAPELWVMDADGGNPTPLTSPPASGGFVPSWSPDGTQIAFSSARTGHPEIWVMDADGSNPRQLTFTATRGGSNAPSWSPDGRRIAFASDRRIAFASDRSGRTQVFTMNPDGSDVRQLTAPMPPDFTDSNVPVWSPDGRQIAFWSGIEPLYGQVWVMDADGRNRRVLTDCPPPTNCDNPGWSADGTQILFETSRSRIRIETWIMDADGKNQRPLFPFPYGAGRLPWRPLREEPVKEK